MDKNVVEKVFEHQAQVINEFSELTIQAQSSEYLDIAQKLKTHPSFHFEQLIDLCVVDMLTYGQAQWNTQQATAQGYGRAVIKQSFENQHQENRFIVVSHFLSVKHNHRIRLKIFVPENLTVESLCPLWPSANWFEREAFDLFGVLFKGHPDMRRLLTDYGFIGHPFRKDFPVHGTVEMRFDAAENRCIYEKVSIDDRVLVPKVIRQQGQKES